MAISLLFLPFDAALSIGQAGEGEGAEGNRDIGGHETSQRSAPARVCRTRRIVSRRFVRDEEIEAVHKHHDGDEGENDRQDFKKLRRHVLVPS